MRTYLNAQTEPETLLTTTTIMNSRLLFIALALILFVTFGSASSSLKVRQDTSSTDAPSTLAPTVAVTTTAAPVVATSEPTTTTTTPAPTHNCWTCPAGNIHWYDTAMTAPDNGEDCQCVLASNYDSHGCLACPANFAHWYDAGLTASGNGDKCQCVDVHTQGVTTTAGPTTTVKLTTKAPVTTKAVTTLTPGSQQAGGNNAKSASSSVTASMLQIIGTVIAAILAVFM
jgi:hypothetical protein